MMDITFRRRAIYTGLKPFLSNSDLLLALQFWEEEFSSKPVYAVNVFIARCCKTPELKAKRSEMLRSVVNAMELDESKLLPDPGSQLNLKLNNQTERRANDGQHLDAKTTVFAALLTSFLSDLDTFQAMKIKQNMADKIFLSKTKERRISQMQDWLNSASSELQSSFYLAFLQKLMNLAYVEMCEMVGAVKADAYLVSAIKETSVMSQHLAFNLHDLL